MSGEFELSATYVDVANQARVVALACATFAEVADESDHFDPDIRRILANSGLVRYTVPEKFGGALPSVDSLAITVAREQLAMQSAHLDSMFCMQGIGSYAISQAGDPEIQDYWLPRVAQLKAIAALGLTEPHVGSDLRSITTTVEDTGSSLRINGHKSFITNAGDADFYVTLATETIQGEKVYSLIFVPADSPGVRVEHPHQILAPHVLGDVIIDNVELPLNHRIGLPGKGFGLVLATLSTFRVSVAGAAVGIAQAALDIATQHAATREQFGVPLAQLGPIPLYLSQSWAEIEMARAFTYRAAAASARDARGSLHLSSLAKVGATEMTGRVVDRCVQIMGRYGITRGMPMERLYREARPLRIYEGATEVIYDSLAKQLVERRLT